MSDYEQPGVDAVRTALGEVTATEIPDSTIRQKLGDADARLTARVDPDSVDGDALARAVRAVAAYEAWTAAPQETQESAVSASATYNVEGYTKRLEQKKERAIERVTGATRGGSSAGFFKTSDSVFDD